MLGKEDQNKISRETIDEQPTLEIYDEGRTDNMISDLSQAGRELKEKVKEYQDMRLDHSHDLKKKEMDEYQHKIEEKRLQLGRKMRQFKFAFTKAKNSGDIKNNQEELYKEIYELFYLQDETNNFYEQMFVYFIGEHNDSKNTIMNLFNEIESKIQIIQNEREFFRTQFLSSRAVQSEQKLLDKDQNEIQQIQNSQPQNKLMLKENQQMKQIIDHKEFLIKSLKKKLANKNFFEYESKLQQLREKVKYISLFSSFKNKEKFFSERIDQIKIEINNNMKVDKAEEIGKKLNDLKATSIFTRFKEKRPEVREKLYSDQKIKIKDIKRRVEIDIKKICKKKNKLKKLTKKIKQNDGLLLNYSAERKMLKSLLNQMNDVPKIYKMIEDVRQKENDVVKENETLQQQIEKLQKQILEHQKDLGNYYVKNLQSIKKLTAFSRTHLSKTSKIKTYLQRKMKEIENNGLFWLIDQGQAEDIHEHYKDLKFVHHCLDKQVISDIGQPKMVQKKKKIRKKNQTKQFNDAFSNKINELKKSANREINQLKEMVNSKEDTLSKLQKVISQMKNINDQLDSDLNEQEILNQNLLKEKLKVQILNEDLKINKEALENYEQMLQQQQQVNEDKQQELKQLAEKVQKQKNILKQINKEKKTAQKQIKESEKLLKEKNEKIREIKNHLDKLKKINEQLKQTLSLQYQKIQKLIEESKTKFVLLEDLTKKDKIFHQLFDIQDKKIQTKDKKILSLETKIVNHQNLIEALLKDKIDGNKGLSEQLSKNLPSNIKKEKKEFQKLEKNFAKVTQEVTVLKKKLQVVKNKNRNLRINTIKNKAMPAESKVKQSKKKKAQKNEDILVSGKSNKNFAKKKSMKKSYTGKSNFHSNDRKIQQSDTLKNINKISSKKSIKESRLTLSLDNNDEDEFLSFDHQKKKIQIEKSSQVNFIFIPPKLEKFFQQRIEKLNQLYLFSIDKAQDKLELLRKKIDKVQVLKQTLLNHNQSLELQTIKQQQNFIDNDKKLQEFDSLSQFDSKKQELKNQILQIINNKNTQNIDQQITCLLATYDINKTQLETDQQNQHLSQQRNSSQEDFNEDQENNKEEDEMYLSLKKQIKGEKQQTPEVLNDKKNNVFSFNQKIEKKSESVYDPNQKNVFIDDTMDQSSMNQNRQKMDQEQLQKIEEDSDFFEKSDENDSEDEDDVDIDFFNNKKKDDVMTFEPSREESLLENQLTVDDKKQSEQQEEIKEEKNITTKQDLLNDFDNGNMFSFSKGYKQFQILKSFQIKILLDIYSFYRFYFIICFLQYS